MESVAVIDRNTQIMRGVGITLLEHEEHKVIPSSDRASFISARKLLFNGVFVVAGPGFGVLIDRFGNHTALLIMAGVILPVLLAGWGWVRREVGMAVE